MSICLQAVALGLAAHQQMGGFDAERMHEALAIPVHITLMSVIAIGYQAAPDSLEEDETRQREIDPANASL